MPRGRGLPCRGVSRGAPAQPTKPAQQAQPTPPFQCTSGLQWDACKLTHCTPTLGASAVWWGSLCRTKATATSFSTPACTPKSIGLISLYLFPGQPSPDSHPQGDPQGGVEGELDGFPLSGFIFGGPPGPWAAFHERRLGGSDLHPPHYVPLSTPG